MLSKRAIVHAQVENIKSPQRQRLRLVSIKDEDVDIEVLKQVGI